MYYDIIIAGVTLVVCAVGTGIIMFGFWEAVKWLFRKVFDIDIVKELKGDADND